ncbi:MAG TPA: VOC family protein [Streptosporangiaceae bacterium]|nr:VOC family protein [Streptosporangiaceae bacterium]
MVTRDKAWPSGTPCWVDLAVDDMARARTFYSRLFGWDIQPGPREAGGYTMCLKDGHPVAGIAPKQGPPGTPSVWTVYLASDDVDETAGKVTAAGGSILAAPVDVMDSGRAAIATDPAGAAFGIWQARQHTGLGLVNEPGSVCWNENFSRDMDGNKAFYSAVFGYEYGDMSTPEFRYATLKVDGLEVGGIGDLGSGFPPDAPAHWSTYFCVGDTDAAVATITGAGGSVMREPRDSPYGRMAVVRDDQGAAFSLMGTLAAPSG